MHSAATIRRNGESAAHRRGGTVGAHMQSPQSPRRAVRCGAMRTDENCAPYVCLSALRARLRCAPSGGRAALRLYTVCCIPRCAAFIHCLLHSLRCVYCVAFIYCLLHSLRCVYCVAVTHCLLHSLRCEYCVAFIYCLLHPTLRCAIERGASRSRRRDPLGAIPPWRCSHSGRSHSGRSHLGRSR
jgi:hypothetical protein